MAQDRSLAGVERYFDDDDIIVSKTDLKGRLTYANKIFLDISGYAEKEVLGHPPHHFLSPPFGECMHSPAGQRDMTATFNVARPP